MEERLIYLIEQLQSGLITDEERVELDSLKTDPAFEAYFKIITDLPEVFESQRAEEIKSRVKSWEVNSGSRYGKGRIILGIIILVTTVISYLLIKSLSTKDIKPADLYVSNLDSYPNIYLPLDRSDNQSEVAKAMGAYENRNFQLSNQIISSLNDSLQSDLNIIFYKAVNDIMLDNKSSAQSGFIQLENDSKYSIPATYYLFLMAVENGDEQSIETLGNKLTYQKSHPKLAAKTTDILSKLGN